jgi:Rod binding domain-containing protein
MFMSRHLAESGGIGLAPYLERQMHANASTKPVASADATTPPAHATHELLPATPRR